MPDEILQYKLQTIFDGTGTTAAAEGLKNVGKEGQKAVEGVKQESDALEDNAKKTEHLGMKKGELKKLVRELGHEFPIAGMAARAMLNPIVAAFSGAIAIFGYAKQKLEEWNKALDEAAERNAGKDFLPGIEAKAKSLNEAAGAAAAFEESLKAAFSAEDQFSTKIKLAIDKLHEFVAAQAEVDSAVEANEIARVNLREKTGKIGDVEGIAQRSAIREKYRKLGEDRKTSGENEELRLKQEEYSHAIDQAPGLEADAGRRRAVADKLKAAQAQATADLPNAQKAMEEAEKAQKQAQEKADKAREKAEANKGVNQFMGIPWDQAARKAEEEATTAAQNYGRAKKRVGQDKQATEEIPVLGAPIFSEAGLAEQRAQRNNQRIIELEKEIGTLKETLPIRQATRAVVSDIKSGTAAMDTQGAIAEKVTEGEQKWRGLKQHVIDAVDSGHAVRESMVEALKAQKKDNAETKAILDQYGMDIKSLINTRKLAVPGT